MRRTILVTLALIPCTILLLPIFIAASALLLFTAAVRAIARAIEPRFVSWTELITFDPALGWKPRPNLDAHYLAEGDDVFRMMTDRDGWAGGASLDDSDVVVIGDSFASGYGVDAGRSFADLAAGVRVKAVGAPGYSMVHGVLLMEQLARRLAGKLVIWFVYLENDLQDNLAPEMRRYRAPFVKPTRPGGWEIVDRHLAPARWQCSNADVRRLFPRLCVPGPLADRAYSAADYLISRAAATCQRVGAHPVIVSIPHPMQLTPDGRARLVALSGRPDSCDPELPDRRLAQCCSRSGIAMIAASASLLRSDYKRREGIHWNRRGHRRVARIVEQLYASHVRELLADRGQRLASAEPQFAGRASVAKL